MHALFRAQNAAYATLDNPDMTGMRPEPIVRHNEKKQYVERLPMIKKHVDALGCGPGICEFDSHLSPQLGEGMENELCGHEFKPGVTCQLKATHRYEHRWYSSKAWLDRTSISSIEWNDHLEQPPPRRERGEAMVLHYFNTSDGEKEVVIAQCILLAHKALDSGQVFEIRAKSPPREEWAKSPPREEYSHVGDYGRRKNYTLEEQAADWGIAWYWLPPPNTLPEGFNPIGITLKQEPLLRHSVKEMKYLPEGGYILIARLKVP